MGIGRFFKSIVDPRTMGEEIIAAQAKSYKVAEKTYPNGEPHLFLMQVWLGRMTLRRQVNPYSHEAQMLAYNETYSFVCLQPPDNHRALGLHFVREERPDIFHAFLEFQVELDRLMYPIIAAQEKGTLENLYRKFNPRMQPSKV